MKLSYFKDTDTLYIDLSERASAESEEIQDGIVFDYDAEGRVVGIEIESAITRVQLDRLEVNDIPSASPVG